MANRRKHDNSIADDIDESLKHVEYALAQDEDCGVYGFNAVMSDLTSYGRSLGTLAAGEDVFGTEALCYQLTYCMWLWSHVDEPESELGDSFITNCYISVNDRTMPLRGDVFVLNSDRGGTQLVANGVTISSLTEYLNFLERKVPKTVCLRMIPGVKKMQEKAQRGKRKAMKFADIN